jgi:hypothetical protein
MSYFERFAIKRTDGKTVNPAEEESITLLRRIFQALKPLGQITGGGSNRLSVDINTGTIATVSTVTTVTTTTTVTNLTNFVPGAGAIGPVTGGGFELMKATSRNAYNNGVRANVS